MTVANSLLRQIYIFKIIYIFIFIYIYTVNCTKWNLSLCFETHILENEKMTTEHLMTSDPGLFCFTVLFLQVVQSFFNLVYGIDLLNVGHIAGKFSLED